MLNLVARVSLVGVAAFVGVLIGRVPTSRAGESDPAVVRTQRLEVTDGAGRVRAQIATGKDGTPSLLLLDDFGRTRVQVAAFSEGASGIALLDANGKMRVNMSLGTSGVSQLAVLYKDGERRAARMIVMEGGEAELVLGDSSGVDRAAVTLARGSTRFALYDSDGKVSGALANVETGTTLHFQRPSGEPTVGLAGYKTGEAALDFYDAKGMARIVLGVRSSGEPRIQVGSSAGGVVWESPRK